jgi:excinuclease ABC subunit B
MTGSMAQAIEETNRRRAKQVSYNDANGITPQSIIRSVDMKLAAIVEADYVTVPAEDFDDAIITSEAKLGEVLAQLEIQMRDAAKKFEFERAAALRDRIRALKQRDISGFFSAAAEPEMGEPMPDGKLRQSVTPTQSQT